MDFPQSRAVAPHFEVLAHTGSTNADLRARAESEHLPHLAVLLTRDQRAGRGRLDRAWEAPPGAALAVSVLLRIEGIAPAERGWIPLVAGLAMREAIAAQLPGRAVAVKWPNDVIVERMVARRGGDATAKLCGILAEAIGPDEVILGTGVNTAMTAEQAPVPTATSFAMLGVECDEDALVAGFLTELSRLIEGLRGADAVSSGIHALASTQCSSLGRRVRVILPEGELRGRARALASDGRLIVDDGAREHLVGAGDVVHLRTM